MDIETRERPPPGWVKSFGRAIPWMLAGAILLSLLNFMLLPGVFNGSLWVALAAALVSFGVGCAVLVRRLRQRYYE